MPVDWDAVEYGIRDRLGRNPLTKKRFSVVAISNDPHGAIVHVEADGRYAVVYYWQQKGERWVEKPRVIFLQDVRAVQERIDEDDRAWCKKYKIRA